MPDMTTMTAPTMTTTGFTDDPNAKIGNIWDKIVVNPLCYTVVA